MRITIEIDDGATASVTTSQTAPAQPGTGASPPSDLLAAAAASGARDGGPAPSGPGSGMGPGSGQNAPAAFLRLPPPPEGAPAAFTGMDSQTQPGGGDLFGGAAPGAPPIAAYQVEQPREAEPAEEETGEAAQESAPEERPARGRSPRGSSREPRG